MGTTWRKHANDRAVGELPVSSFTFILISLLLILNISSPHQSPPTMAITMRPTISKEKPISQALAAIAATPVERHQDRRSGRLARSPRTSKVNKHLAEINRPTIRLDNVLQALQPSRSPTSDNPIKSLNAPCDLSSPTDKSGRKTSLDLPTGGDIQDGAP
jgi:hypothetical protein